MLMVFATVMLSEHARLHAKVKAGNNALVKMHRCKTRWLSGTWVFLLMYKEGT